MDLPTSWATTTLTTTLRKTFRTTLTFVCLSTFVACARSTDGIPVLPDEKMTEEQAVAEEVRELSVEEQKELEEFEEPTEAEIEKVTTEASSSTSSKYKHIDRKRLIPATLLNAALAYYEKNYSRIQNKNYLSVINFAARSNEKRLFVIEMKTGAVWALHMAHGSGSDRNNDGYAESFSNRDGSHASSLGFYRAAETYSGNFGYSMRLDGLSDTNSNARRRAVVMHGSHGVADQNVIQGRSWGCPAVSYANRTAIINRLNGGSIIYAGLAR